MNKKFSFFESAVQMQKAIKDPDEKARFEIVKRYARKADKGDKNALEWLEYHFSPRVKPNSIWDKNSIYIAEQVNLRGGIPASLYSVRRRSRLGQ